MKPYQQRVVDERAELDEKISRLDSFLYGPAFNNLDEAEQYRLERQYDAMEKYSQVLGERIANFKE